MGNKTSKKRNISTKRATGSRVLPEADWLVVGGDFSITLFEKCYIDELEELYQSTRKRKKMKGCELFVPDYRQINNDEVVFSDDDDDIIIRAIAPIKGTYPYYRKIAAYSSQNPAIGSMPLNGYFLFAQYYGNTISNKIIAESLRLSLLCNLSKLAKDKTVQYDLRDAATGQYLYHKIKRFGVNGKLFEEQLEALTKVEHKPWENMEKRNWIANDYDVETQYDIDNDCMTYDLSDNGKKVINNLNSTFIHDLIDPNKYLFENKLWIPAIFDCTKDIKEDKHLNVMHIITSPILGLDYVKYKALYEDIAKIFKIIIQPMFENILNYKLGCNEKIVVKSMKYILQKPGDVYRGNIHREGMGENIIAVAVYYPQITSEKNGMRDGKLKLSIADVFNQFLKCGGQDFEIEQGSCIAFSNQGFHQVPEINYSSVHQDNNECVMRSISRTILTFFIINQYHSEHLKVSNENGCIVNLAFYWIYYISYWLRIYAFDNSDNQWFTQLIHKYLFEQQFEDYVYYKRHEQRQEKGKPLIEQILDNDSSNWTGEETFYIDPTNYD